MEHGPFMEHLWVVHLILGILAALNVALNTWLVNRRLSADRRERKNGLHDSFGRRRYTEEEVERLIRERNTEEV